MQIQAILEMKAGSGESHLIYKFCKHLTAFKEQLANYFPLKDFVCVCPNTTFFKLQKQHHSVQR